MSNKQFLPLPTSVDNFAELITSSYYVDKTPYLKKCLRMLTTAKMISLKLKAQTYCSLQDKTFWQALLMNMFESFLQISGKEPKYY